MIPIIIPITISIIIPVCNHLKNRPNIPISSAGLRTSQRALELAEEVEIPQLPWDSTWIHVIHDLDLGMPHGLGNLWEFGWIWQFPARHTLPLQKLFNYSSIRRILTECDTLMSPDDFIKDSCRLVICEEKLCRFNALRRRFGLCAKGVRAADILNYGYSSCIYCTI